jgi:hypothetical protein
MTTFTLRAPNELTRQLSSAEMRSWLTDFVGNPHSLPPDPGSGDGRVSLTLPNDVVHVVAGYSRCSVSSALRRIASERIKRLGKTIGKDAPQSIRHSSGFPTIKGTASQRDLQPGGLMAQIVIWILCFSVLLYFRFVKDKWKDNSVGRAVVGVDEVFCAGDSRRRMKA